MADFFSKGTRSRIMSRISGKNTSPELKLRKQLHLMGYRYSLRYRFKELNFKPDIVMVSRKICIFVDGCFWHRCPRCYKAPKTNKKYWLPKIERNVQRDKEQNRYLKTHGWKVIRIWEHDIDKNLDKILKMIIVKISTN